VLCCDWWPLIAKHHERIRGPQIEIEPEIKYDPPLLRPTRWARSRNSTLLFTSSVWPIPSSDLRHEGASLFLGKV
jgi:hypothetical protein